MFHKIDHGVYTRTFLRSNDVSKYNLSCLCYSIRCKKENEKARALVTISLRQSEFLWQIILPTMLYFSVQRTKHIIYCFESTVPIIIF